MAAVFYSGKQNGLWNTKMSIETKDHMTMSDILRYHEDGCIVLRMMGNVEKRQLTLGFCIYMKKWYN
jgi:hypothetical protein